MIVIPKPDSEEGWQRDLTSVRTIAAVWLGPKPHRCTAPFSIPDTLLMIQSHRKVPLSPASVRVRDDRR